MDTGLEGVSSNVRSRDELQKAVDFVVARSAQMNKPLYLFDENEGKNVRSADPGVPEVMQLLRMNQGDQSRLASALYQLEMAQDGGRKQAYTSRTAGPTVGVTFDAPEAVDSSQMQVSRLLVFLKDRQLEVPGGQRQTIVEQLAQA